MQEIEDFNLKFNLLNNPKCLRITSSVRWADCGLSLTLSFEPAVDLTELETIIALAINR
ncbi:hypothetical protein Pmar_PMAR025844 [Perkinsus marinus ATCC 50983]|uniref:Uncharacterized protein n=1 Tax=Perkinsus marinus (strain ATCC 50983 / TXsc) TaxID=423536 RepID=C5LUV6_PERM5|nr:hypothetical protein Pmar_PMAR025844 [Perkinsus marinus ATCC 50983]EEQ99456.1 hypothetical protein Pmar_PMAR025844 [Perkinsus marinus ATCC 50983]|eukprot:XP_002766739.1 hypothetical protein Pmar_PMAR025844 [Perkinsus marinus ATCC 50983]